MRWISREVRRFCAEGHIHLPFLLRVAAAPAEIFGENADITNDDGEIELEMTDELHVTQAQTDAEAADEPEMMKHAGYWDDFLALMAESVRAWACAEEDTDEYRQGRTVKAFNLGAVCHQSC